MVDLTNEEKTLLRTANKLRSVVKEDLIKTASPALTAFMKAILPALSKTDKETRNAVASLPHDSWIHVARNTASVLTDKKSQEDTKQESLRVISSTSKKLDTKGVKNSKHIATAVVMAALQTVADHKKSSNTKLVEAVRMIKDVQSDLELLREFL